MTRTLINQFSELVKDHMESTLPILHEIDLGVGPTNGEQARKEYKLETSK